MQDIKDKIMQLKMEKNAVILAHYYVPGDVQDIADYIGDSYYLSKIAAQVKEKVIVFCGVYFMGESAKILNPLKTVLMPDLKADCPMAHMANVSDIKKIREKYNDLAVVCYINSTAEIKAHSDVCVTSSNALQVIKSLPNQYIYFIPDKNLGRYISRLVPEKTFFFNDGYCHVHALINEKDIIEKKQEYPDAKVVAHPECRLEILELADYVGSTSGIINYILKSDSTDYIVCTETGVFHEIGKKIKGKNLYPATVRQICSDMKMNTIEKVLYALENFDTEVKVHEAVIKNALLPLNRMLKLAEVKSNE